MMWEGLSALLLFAGALLGLAGAMGLHRFPDFYTRLHALGMTDSLCAFLVLAGLALQEGLTLASLKLGLIFGFLFFTNPTSSYALGHAARQAGLPPMETKHD
ncbi:monovalent cation/H(+) antiporter subunit G [Aliiglaciecola sp. CAU 1673]|uniref:monovalent cation/H(+) antiporter subunit G n=1 Tax=Aliiglaciecola sp. CAU 1673 TaxID=3032595 RepID=UPI0023DBEDD8|nr:monovalent cation/H(+) antiporter subunit G [Aliiglaciecola sp. CAU 1673]MDF2179841.1 monovalent cation/H(+) antiporter subunit G [Aliiglaciecola sp. CAU 1673]